MWRPPYEGWKDGYPEKRPGGRTTHTGYYPHHSTCRKRSEGFNFTTGLMRSKQVEEELSELWLGWMDRGAAYMTTEPPLNQHV